MSNFKRSDIENGMVLGNEKYFNSIPTKVCICSMCGEDIFDGDVYYELFGEKYCENCIDDCKRRARS